MYPLHTGELKSYKFSLSIKTYISHYIVETEMRFSSGAGTTLIINEERGVINIGGKVDEGYK